MSYDCPDRKSMDQPQPAGQTHRPWSQLQQHARHHLKAVSAENAEPAGQNQFLMYHMGSTNDLVSSEILCCPPGREEEAPSFKLQAASYRSSSIKRQASSVEAQASSFKPQATSSLIRVPRYKDHEKVFMGKGPRAFTKMNVFLGCATWNAI